MMSCSAIKARGRRRKGGHLPLQGMSSQVTIMRDEALLSQGWLHTSLATGSSERITCFVLLV